MSKKIKARELAEKIEKNHDIAIPEYVQKLKEKPTNKFKVIRAKGFEENLLQDFFLNGMKVRELSEKYGVATGTVSVFLNDYLMSNYDDSKVEETAIMDSTNHLGIMSTFFANVMFASRESAMNALFARQLRDEIANSMSTRGVLETAKDKDLMYAWNDVAVRTEKFSNVATKQLDTYLKLMEKVLDKQKEVAFVKILYDLLQKLEPKVVERLNKALSEDPYAKAVLESMSGENIIKNFQLRKEGKLLTEKQLHDIEIQKTFNEDN